MVVGHKSRILLCRFHPNCKGSSYLPSSSCAAGSYEAGLELLGRSSSPRRSCEEWSSYDETEPEGTEPPTPYGTEYRTEPSTPTTVGHGHGGPDHRFGV